MNDELIEKYLFAKTIVIDYGYEDELHWQSAVTLDDLTESRFMAELAWVILNSGMRESVIENLFSDFSEAFYNWESARLIVDNESSCRENALKVFNHKKKVDAIIFAAKTLYDKDFSEVKDLLENCDPIEILKNFRYIGDVTAYHLAKNIGFPVAKPDRHLVRIARSFGYDDVQIFCRTISESTGDPVPVVDLVFWRFATIEKDYIDVLTSLNVGIEKNAN